MIIKRITNKERMVKMKNLGLVSVVLLGMALGSCSKDNDVNGDLGGTPHQ